MPMPMLSASRASVRARRRDVEISKPMHMPKPKPKSMAMPRAMTGVTATGVSSAAAGWPSTRRMTLTRHGHGHARSHVHVHVQGKTLHHSLEIHRHRQRHSHTHGRRPRLVFLGSQLDATSSESQGTGSERPSRSDLYANENLDRLELVAPDDKVEDIMTPGSTCATARPEDTLADARLKLQDYRIEGMPVVDETNRVLGVVSRHDIRPLLRRKDYKSYFDATTVGQIMSTPPVCVRPHARIGEAAGVMLAYKVHRLPVVDESGTLLGLISRTDVFQPLLRKKESVMGSQRRLWINGSFPDTTFVDLDGFDSLVSVAEDDMEIAVPASSLQNWDVKYLYDAECNLCLMLVDMLKRRDAKGKICFVNLRDPDYDPRLNQGISFEEGMKTIHVIRKDNTILQGPEALQELYDVASLGWVQAIMKIPVISFLVGIAYKIIAALRLPMNGESMDAILAARRMRSAENDDMDWVCTEDEDEGCEVPDDW